MGNLLSKLISTHDPVTVPWDQDLHPPPLQLHRQFDVGEELVGKGEQWTRSRHPGRPTLHFNNFPPEIRIMIWKEATLQGRRLLIISAYQQTEGFFSPPSPVTTRICRESRQVALRYGLWYDDSLHLQQHRRWFNPAVDVILLGHHQVNFTRSLEVNNRFEHVAVFVDPTTGLKMQHYKLILCCIEGIALYPDRWKNLRTIDVILLPEKYSLISNDLRSAALRELFGSDTVVTVDLRDEEEFTRTAELLRQDYHSQTHLDLLNIGHCTLKGNSRRLAFWGDMVDYAKYCWLRGTYQHEILDAADAIMVSKDKTSWDLDHPWIKRTLSRMPELRPMFMLARQDHTWKPKRNRVFSSILATAT